MKLTKILLNKAITNKQHFNQHLKLFNTLKHINSISSSKSFSSQYSNNYKKTIITPRKDYYAILEISRNASLNEIKKAYRLLAKKYHPDVNTSTSSSGSNSHEPNVEKFRDIAEAYAVLSNTTLKVDYDRKLKPKPEVVYNSEKMKNMEKSRSERDASGNIKRTVYSKGSYGDMKMAKLDELKKQFNFDHLGNFKGGVPRPNSDGARGGAYGMPGSQYSRFLHNEEFSDNPTIKPITHENTENLRYNNNAYKTQSQRLRPYFNLEEVPMDYQFNLQDKFRWMTVTPLLGFISLFLFYKINQKSDDYYYAELDRKKPNMLTHEFERMGAMLIVAPVFKTPQKFLTRYEYHKWLLNDIRTFK